MMERRLPGGNDTPCPAGRATRTRAAAVVVSGARSASTLARRGKPTLGAIKSVSLSWPVPARAEARCQPRGSDKAKEPVGRLTPAARAPADTTAQSP